MNREINILLKPVLRAKKKPAPLNDTGFELQLINLLSFLKGIQQHRQKTLSLLEILLAS